MDELSREQLEEQVELLRQQLGALMGSNQEIGVLLSLRHGMTQRLAIILSLLVNRSPAALSRDTLHRIFFGDRSDGGPDPRIFNVHMTRLRQALKRIGAQGKIETIWNAGFVASPELVKWVRDLYAERIPQEK